MRRTHRAGILALIATLALAGCATGATGHASATVTTAPTTTPTPQTSPITQCGPHFPDTPTTTLDGMVVTAAALMGNMANPQMRIPDGAPLAPYALSGAAPSQAPTAEQVNPRLTAPGGGYVLTICNTSGQTLRIDGETVTIASVTPFTGSLATSVFCSSMYIAEQQMVVKPACGGADIENDYMSATFPSGAGVGSTASATMGSVSPVLSPKLGPLPVSLPPNQMMSIEVGLTGPAGPATYIFSFALAVDGAAPKTVATSQPTLLAPVTQAWTGENCQTSAMLAKMPASGQFVCPPAS